MADMSASERLALITENLQEVLNQPLIEDILAEGGHPKIYWGIELARLANPIADTSVRIPFMITDDNNTESNTSIYAVPAVKIAQFLAAGCDITAPLELVEYRAKYYQFIITAMLQAVGVATEKLKFVLGSSYQTSSKYVMDVYKLSSLVTEHEAKRAGSEIVKQSNAGPLSGLLYPILQILGQ
ncbi:hypothetical protein EYZ11_001971 [Aspergillus tanneri]|uniref:Uncharacterized protein n=1 Tax=Aspergillus tanneri TaxID=1220188 RepID=A0A4S3JU76_9EURO|nr:hypothetical protein EYZ11_001971 [Aspergillus tanneri]